MFIRKCLIVDDSEAAVLVLEQHFQKLPLFEVLVATTYSEAVNILISKKIDLLLLDIELPDFSGLTLLKNMPNVPPTIIVSAYSQYAADSYEIGKAADYLVKPFSFERLLMAVNRALSIQITSKSFQELDYVFLKMGRKFQRIELNEIIYVEAYGIYVKVHTAKTTYVVNESISSILDKLTMSQFMRIHKSYIINLNKITSFGHEFFYIDEYKIPIGISFKSKVEGVMQLFNNATSD